MNSRQLQLDAFNRLLDIMDDLRAKCPWDKKQTLESLRHLTIEETYELGDAILNNDLQEIKKELGDLLLHIVFYAKIGSETNDFDMADVCNGICDKLIYRHPHIYGDVVVADEEEVKQNWEKLKLKEGKKSVLEGVYPEVSGILTEEKFKELYEYSTNDPHDSFIVINHNMVKKSNSYRKNWDISLDINSTALPEHET